MDGTRIPAREYLRVSRDRSGRMRSNSEQHDENVTAAEAHGFALGEPYAEDRAVSASRYSKKARDDFAELLDDLEHGRFGAEVLILWESSRGSRKVGEWVQLIELCEAAGVRIHVTTHHRTYDCSNPRDRRSLLEDAVDSEYESGKTSTRLRRTAAANAAAGRPHGRPPYGYRRVFDERTGRLLGWAIDPVEGPIKREIYERVRAGHSLRAIARDLEERGVRGRTGVPFTSNHLRPLLRPADIGKRTHHGELVDGTWEPLVSEDLYYAVRRILDDPARKVTRHGRAVHEFSMIIRCDVCGGALAVTWRNRSRRAKPGVPGPPMYVCRDHGCTRLPQAEVDEILRAAIFAYLARRDVYEAFASPRADSDEVRKLDAELARLRAELDEAERTTPDTVHEAKTLGRLVEKLTGDIADAEARHRALTLPPALADLVAPGVDIAARWEATPLPARRKVAELLLSPRYLGEVRVQRSPIKNRRVPAGERLAWRRD